MLLLVRNVRRALRHGLELSRLKSIAAFPFLDSISFSREQMLDIKEPRYGPLELKARFDVWSNSRSVCKQQFTYQDALSVRFCKQSCNVEKSARADKKTPSVMIFLSMSWNACFRTAEKKIPNRIKAKPCLRPLFNSQGDDRAASNEILASISSSKMQRPVKVEKSRRTAHFCRTMYSAFVLTISDSLVNLPKATCSGRSHGTYGFGTGRRSCPQ